MEMKYISVKVRSAFRTCMQIFEALADGLYDTFKVIKYTSGWWKGYELERIEPKLHAAAHVLEKGMSLPDVRLGYGASGLRSLYGLMNAYVKSGFPPNRLAYQNAISVLHAYVAYHKEREHDVNEVKKRLTQYELSCDQSLEAGTVGFPLEEYRKLATGNFEQLAQSRFSIRAYGPEPVRREDIYKAMEIARKTPSACNRQSWRVYWVRSKKKKEEILKLHNGHRGFGDTIESFLVITADIKMIFGTAERNQVFVDGGLYSMSLLYALHYVGLGACPMNWCVRYRKDKAFHRMLDIPDSEAVVMLIAVGSLPSEVIAAKSERKAVDDILKVVE
ncbi:nitroreductase family protein [Pontiellaceae bacterium B12219]|nr:nitroreductase family protein [Pontiellaceae bacterium B12219]